MSTELRNWIYKNNLRSVLYREATKPPVLPCLVMIEWMARRIDHERRTILNFQGKHVASYQDLMLNKMYHFKEAQVRMTPECLQSKSKSINFLTIMKGWWKEGNFSSNPTNPRWKT